MNTEHTLLKGGNNPGGISYIKYCLDVQDILPIRINFLLEFTNIYSINYYGIITNKN